MLVLDEKDYDTSFYSSHVTVENDRQVLVREKIDGKYCDLIFANDMTISF